MIEQIVGGYRPDADDWRVDEAWGRQLGSLATEDLLAIRDQVQTLLEQARAEREPEHLPAGRLPSLAEGLLQRFQQSSSPADLAGAGAEAARSDPDARPADPGEDRG